MLQEKSYGSLKIISINRNDVLTRLRDIGRVICQNHPEVESIHLFGSLARGDQVGTSDVDVLVLVRETGLDNPLELIQRYLRYFDLPIGVDLLVLDEISFERRLEKGEVFILKLWGECIELARCGNY